MHGFQNNLILAVTYQIDTPETVFVGSAEVQHKKPSKQAVHHGSRVKGPIEVK